MHFPDCASLHMHREYTVRMMAVLLTDVLAVTLAARETVRDCT